MFFSFFSSLFSVRSGENGWEIPDVSGAAFREIKQYDRVVPDCACAKRFYHWGHSRSIISPKPQIYISFMVISSISCFYGFRGFIFMNERYRHFRKNQIGNDRFDMEIFTKKFEKHGIYAKLRRFSESYKRESTMTFTAAVLIFISVFMHVAWNMLSKSTRPSTSFYIVMNFIGGIIWLPFFLKSFSSFQGLPPVFYFLLIGSCVFEVIYMYGLAHGYKHGDISLIYPLVRALPVVMLAVITLLTGIGKSFGMITFSGMILIAAGCFIMPFPSLRNISLKGLNGKTLLFIGLGAVGTTGYTLCDSQALYHLGNGETVSNVCTLGYLFLIQMGLSLGEIPLIVFDPAERSALKQFRGKSMIYPVIAGIFSSGAYALILFAMQHVSNVSYIQAFRQLSLPLGFLAGVIFLHEKSSSSKVTGLAMILLGLLIVAFTK